MRNFVRIIAAVALAVMSIAGIGGVAVAAPAGSITGFVYTDNGTPLEGAYANAYDWDTLIYVGNARSNADGSYSITGLDSGTYMVKTHRTGYLSEYWNEASTYAEAEPVTVVDPITTTDIDFTLTPGTSILGFVYQDDEATPIEMATVRVYENVTVPGTWNWLATTISNADGSYAITTGSGSYLVRAEAMGYASEYYDNATTIGAATPVLVAADNDTTGINFSLSQIGYISGTVYHEDGVTPLASATIDARDNVTQALIGRTTSGTTSGSYYINLPPGTYRIVATRSGYMSQWWDNFTVVSGSPTAPENWDNATPVPVVGTDETPNIDFSLFPVQAVATNDATDVWTDVATLNGTLTSKGMNDNVTVCFEWGTTDGGPWPNSTDNQSMTSTGTFSANLTGLIPGTAYYFKAKAVGDIDPTPFYGIERSFTTNSLMDPEVITTDATLVTAVSARLNGDLITMGTADNVTVWFVGGPDEGGPYTEETPRQTMTSLGSFYFDVDDLDPKTTYYFKAMAESSDGGDEGDEKSFTTLGVPPSVTTNAATLLTLSSARMNGTLTDLGTADNVTVWFRGGTVQGGPYDAPVGSQVLDAPGAFYFDATGLTPGTTYYYVAIAQGDGAEVWGSEQSATTLTTAPVVTTGAASNLTITSVTLNGSLTSLGTDDNVTVSFAWGTTAGGPYPNVTDNQTMNSTGAFTADLSGLSARTTYYYMARAVGDGTALGDEVSFTTLSTPPEVATSAATDVAATSATLNGSLGSLGTAAGVTVSFEWGATTSYGSETTGQSLTTVGAFTANLTGLTASTTYHFRVKAVGHGAAVYGEDMTFTTASLSDTTAPTISAVASSGITASKATITWTTNEAATSRVEYGLTQEYGSFTTLDTNLVTSHSVELTGLKAGKTYHYRVISEDASGNEAVSSDFTFETKASSGGMPVWAWVLIGLAVVAMAGAAAFLIKGRLAKA